MTYDGMMTVTGDPFLILYFIMTNSDACCEWLPSTAGVIVSKSKDETEFRKFTIANSQGVLIKAGLGIPTIAVIYFSDWDDINADEVVELSRKFNLKMEVYALSQKYERICHYYAEKGALRVRFERDIGSYPDYIQSEKKRVEALRKKFKAHSETYCKA